MAEEHPSPSEELRQAQTENRSLRAQMETLTNNSAEMREELQTITGQRDRYYQAMRLWRGPCIVVAVIAVIELLMLVL